MPKFLLLRRSSVSQEIERSAMLYASCSPTRALCSTAACPLMCGLSWPSDWNAKHGDWAPRRTAYTSGLSPATESQISMTAASPMTSGSIRLTGACSKEYLCQTEVIECRVWRAVCALGNQAPRLEGEHPSCHRPLRVVVRGARTHTRRGSLGSAARLLGRRRGWPCVGGHRRRTSRR